MGTQKGKSERIDATKRSMPKLRSKLASVPEVESIAGYRDFSEVRREVIKKYPNLTIVDGLNVASVSVKKQPKKKQE